ncbi:MAG: hypothetical protein AAB536_00300 [Patescibacteria group bacterium]
MSKSIQEDFLYKKVYEFSYATARIASSAKNKDIAVILETKAVHLLDSVLVADYEKTADLVNSIISIAGFMVDSGLLHPANREILVRESENIGLAIKALPKKEALPDLNLNKIFSKSVLPIKRQNHIQSAKANSQSETKEIQSEIADNGSTKLTTSKIADEIADKSNDESNSFKSEARQSAIMEKLQQTENCRLNKLQEIFPGVGERTLRYDLESLVSRGFIERIGSRRNSVYRLKTRPGSVIELPVSVALPAFGEPS